MEGYAYSYPESGDSSPRSREIDFDNNPPPSWEDQQPPPTHKVKFMVSYNGKIQPRTHDNILSYVGGETKILAVDRSVKFNSLISKLSSLIVSDDPSAPVITSFKYQLPGEDLDALISVTNDDDLEHMMHEYDRLYRASAKPARLRLFVFPGQSPGFGSASSEPGKLERERFVEALNSGPVPDPLPPAVDFLFGLENKVPVHAVNPVQESDRVILSDPQIDARIQELKLLQISAQEQQQQAAAVYRPKSEENLVGGYAGDAYQKPPPTIPASVQMAPAGGYWKPVEQQQQQQQQHYQPPPQPQHQQQQQQPVYMIHTGAPPANVYHTPAVRPVNGQGYYQMQRVQSDPIYREQPVYNMAAAQQVKMTGYTEGMGVPVRQVAGMPQENTGGGYQVAYDNGGGRQVYYAAPGVVTAPYQGVAVSGGDMRAAADGKVAGPKITQTSAAV